MVRVIREWLGWVFLATCVALIVYSVLPSESLAQPSETTLPQATPTEVSAATTVPPSPSTPPNPSAAAPVATTPTVSTHPEPTFKPVAAALPLTLEISAPGTGFQSIRRQFGVPVRQECDKASTICQLTPPEVTLDDLARVYWWSERAQFANPGQGTVYVYGHTCRTCPSAFNSLQTLAGLEGKVTQKVTTPNGTFTYLLARTDSILKAEMGSRVDLYGTPQQVNADLVDITCFVRVDKQPADHVFVAWWKLLSVS